MCKLIMVLSTLPSCAPLSADYDVEGVALLIAALVQNKTLSLYHKHIVYDIVNFTGYLSSD